MALVWTASSHKVASCIALDSQQNTPENIKKFYVNSSVQCHTKILKYAEANTSQRFEQVL